MWERIPGSLKMVSAGQAGVWGVNRQNQVLYQPGTYGGHLRLRYSKTYFTLVRIIYLVLLRLLK